MSIRKPALHSPTQSTPSIRPANKAKPELQLLQHLRPRHLYLFTHIANQCKKQLQNIEGPTTAAPIKKTFCFAFLC
ncbi:hypothetical protein CsSME_00028677 [Camellia sinensis var. sinensis]